MTCHYLSQWFLSHIYVKFLTYIWLVNGVVLFSFHVISGGNWWFAVTIGNIPSVIYSMKIIGIDHLYKWVQCKCETVHVNKPLCCSSIGVCRNRLETGNKAKIQPDAKSPKDTPCLALTDELWGVFCEYFWENWVRYSSTALYYFGRRRTCQNCQSLLQKNVFRTTNSLKINTPFALLFQLETSKSYIQKMLRNIP